MKTLSKILIAIGVIILIGTAGASDMGGVDFMQILKHLLIGVAFIVFGNTAKVLPMITSKILNCFGYEKIKAYPYFGEVK